MITDRDLADLCVALYAYPGSTPLDWDHYDSGATSDGVCWAIKEIEDISVFVLRGSTTTQDWRRDFTAWADPFHHDDLGPVHPGFLSGMRTVQREVFDLVPADRKIIVTGHSLGAARASVLAGLLVLSGRPPIARIVFGEPRPGFQQLADVLAHVPGRSYRNGDASAHDVVTDVPFSVPPEDYVHPTPLIEVCAPPEADVRRQWSVFAWHHMPLYAKALAENAHVIEN